MRVLMILAGATFAATTLPAAAASIEKEIDLRAPAEQVWKIIGPFCSISRWHPAIGKCTEDRGVRTLVTKDGKAVFVEKLTKDDASAMEYSYEIEKSPLPIKDYRSTLKVVVKGANESRIIWSSSYTPEEGKAAVADQAIAGIYQSGLDNIRKLTGERP